MEFTEKYPGKNQPNASENSREKANEPIIIIKILNKPLAALPGKEILFANESARAALAGPMAKATASARKAAATPAKARKKAA